MIIFFALDRWGGEASTHNCVSMGRYGTAPEEPRRGLDKLWQELIEIISCAAQYGCIISGNSRLAGAQGSATGVSVSRQVQWVTFLHVTSAGLSLSVPGFNATSGSRRHSRSISISDGYSCYEEFALTFTRILTDYLGTCGHKEPIRPFQPYFKAPTQRALDLLATPGPSHIGAIDSTDFECCPEDIMSIVLRNAFGDVPQGASLIADRPTAMDSFHVAPKQASDPDLQDPPPLSARRVADVFEGGHKFSDDFFMQKNRGALSPTVDGVDNAQDERPVSGNVISPSQALRLFILDCAPTAKEDVARPPPSRTSGAGLFGGSHNRP